MSHTSPFSAFNQPVTHNPFAKAIKSQSISQLASLSGVNTATRKPGNPFLSAQNMDSPEFKASYGVNQPLNEAMFLGYRDDKPILAGSRLFILY